MIVFSVIIDLSVFFGNTNLQTVLNTLAKMAQAWN